MEDHERAKEEKKKAHLLLAPRQRKQVDYKGQVSGAESSAAGAGQRRWVTTRSLWPSCVVASKSHADCTLPPNPHMCRCALWPRVNGRFEASPRATPKQ